MNDDIDERLASLSRATADLRPRPGFSARVAQAISERGVTPGDWSDDIRIPARRMLPMAALAALVSLFFAAKTASAFDEAVVDSIEGTENTW